MQQRRVKGEGGGGVRCGSRLVRVVLTSPGGSVLPTDASAAFVPGPHLLI